MIRLAIAEDHKALIDGIKAYLEYEEDIQIVGSADNGRELLEMVKLKTPSIVLCDIRMPILDGIEVTTILNKDYPHIKVIAFTMFDQPEAVKKMLESGAVGYILKNSGLEVLLEGIRQVASGKKYFDKKVHVSDDSDNSSISILSSREKEILNLIVKGRTSHQIADELYIGKSTVDTHRKNMIRKLNLSGSGELMRYALEKKYKFN